MVIKTCYGVQHFKLEVSTFNMNENIGIWNLLIYKTIWSSILIGFLLICKTILFPYMQDHLMPQMSNLYKLGSIALVEAHLLIYKTNRYRNSARLFFSYMQDHYV